MRNITKLVAGAGLAAGSVLTLTVGATSAQAVQPTDRSTTTVAQANDLASQSVTVTGRKYQGCPYGAVCIYPRNKGWNHGHPSNVYWSFGSHKLHNQYGKHYVFNNQTPGSGVWLCKGSNGTKCYDYIASWTYGNKNLTPVNSIKLVH
ncbi:MULTISPECIES: hypothetical protein [Kribbella]|uniref:Peptidase inhibitor family I36 n=1 Tax=Kribbella karoonensis TaxID=324851 RepID=A0ABP4PRY5_9ACTN